MKEATRSKRARGEWSRWGLAAVVVVLLCVVVVWQKPVQAGGALLVGGPTLGSAGVAYVWSTTAAVSYHTDLGTLGSLNTAAADGVVRDSFDVWQNVTTASISFSRTGNLGVDVVGGASDPSATPPKVNHEEFFDAFINGCSAPVAPSPTTAVNAIVYDTDGTITEDILGAGQENEVIGFAGAVCLTSTAPNRITRGRAVLNGKFQDGAGSPTDLSPNQFEQVFTHEFGHLIGLDHSQINNEVSNQAPGDRTDDDLFGLPLMFPALLSGSPARVDNGFLPLAPDDEAWVSFLYPQTSGGTTFNGTFGRIEGRVFAASQTPIQGVNVLARLEDDAGTVGVDESRRFAYSSTSGYRFTGNPGQSVTGTNTGGSDFGSRDPTLIGFYAIPVKAGTYSVQAEAIDPEWVDGSRVGPLGSDAGEQFPPPGTIPAATAPFAIAAGGVVTRNITLTNTPPRFDDFETARLEWREPASAWLRERRPPAFQVAG